MTYQSRTKQSIDAIPAKVSYSHAVGNIVYVELKRDGTDEYLEAEITKEQFKQLNIQAGDFVYVQPKSESVYSGGFCNLRVFTLKLQNLLIRKGLLKYLLGDLSLFIVITFSHMKCSWKFVYIIAERVQTTI